MKKKNKKKDEHPHFAKVVDYTKEPWRTDILLGQKESDSHGHIALSGATIFYLRDEQGKEIIVNSDVVSKNASQ